MGEYSKNAVILSVLTVMVMLCSSIAIAQTPPIPTPPAPADVSMPNTFKEFSVTEKSFGVGGSALLQTWTFFYEAEDAFYIIQEAHMVLTPTTGDDIERIYFQFFNPGYPYCSIYEYFPKLNSEGVTIAGSIGVIPGKGPKIGPAGGIEITAGADGTEVEDIEISPQKIKWEVDFDDLSKAAAKTATLDFYANWRCPKVVQGGIWTEDRPLSPFFAESTKVAIKDSHNASKDNQSNLQFEIDDFGTDTVYELYKDNIITKDDKNFWEDDKLKDREVSQLTPIELDYPNKLGFVSGNQGLIRAKAYANTPSDLYGSYGWLYLQDKNGQVVTTPMHYSKTNYKTYPYYVEFYARPVIPEDIAQIVPQVSITYPILPIEFATGGSFPIIQQISSATTPITIPAGHSVYQLQGPVGGGFELEINNANSLGVPPTMYESGTGYNGKILLEGQTLTGAYSEKGPLLVFHVQEDETPPELTVKNNYTFSMQEIILFIFILLGLLVIILLILFLASKEKERKKE